MAAIFGKWGSALKGRNDSGIALHKVMPVMASLSPARVVFKNALGV